MAYKMPFDSMSGTSHFYDNSFHSQDYSQEDFMDVQPPWMGNIDPSLIAQGQGTPMGWPKQQQPLQRFISQPERAFFTAPAQHLFPQNLTRYSEPTTALPRASGLRMVSPAPSQELSSTCSSARSPPAENEFHLDTYYSPQHQDDFSMSMATSNLNQGLPDPCSDRAQIPPFSNSISGFSCVNLSQVQGFADPQEVAFGIGDDDYRAMENRAEYEIDNRHLRVPESYRHSSDEGIGASIKGDGSPRDSASSHLAEEDLDVDADAEYDPETDNEIIVVAAPIDSESDTDYTPKSTRSRKRRATKPFSSSPTPANKRSRPTKTPTTPTSKSSTARHSCPTHPTFKNATAPQRHVNGAHTRPFICVFAFGGCTSTFASKNEWKRHVATQHLGLSVWVCQMGACAKGSSTAVRGSPGGIEFNRKDLFTQHLRRMHNPEKRKGVRNVDWEGWEARVRELQVECLVEKRKAPWELGCVVRGCGAVFKGRAAWDERMEHVGRHLEKDGCGSGVGVGVDGGVGEEEIDSRLVEWAVREGVVERKRGGGFVLAGTVDGLGAIEVEGRRWRGSAVVDASGFVVDEDIDADGEEE